jgi:hypothetical protein
LFTAEIVGDDRWREALVSDHAVMNGVRYVDYSHDKDMIDWNRRIHKRLAWKNVKTAPHHPTVLAPG